MPGAIYLNTNWATAAQQLVPTDVIARFRSYDYLLAFTAIPVGYAIAGPLASAIGVDKVLAIAAVVIVVSAIIPTLLPAVRVVVRHSDGTITGPPAPAGAEGPGGG